MRQVSHIERHLCVCSCVCAHVCVLIHEKEWMRQVSHWKTWAHSQIYSAQVIWKEHILCNTMTHSYLVTSVSTSTGWRRVTGCLIVLSNFPQKSPIISGSFVRQVSHWKTWAHTQIYSAQVIWKEHILCKTLQDTARHCNNTLQQHTATTHCNNTLQQHTATTLMYAHTNLFCAGDVDAQDGDTQ